MQKFVKITKEHFESILPTHKVTGEKLWRPMGIVAGQYQYVVQVNDSKRIIIRSSIGQSESSDPTVVNHIYQWVEYFKHGQWWASGLDATTFSTIGFQGRMLEETRNLYVQAKAA